MHRTPYASLIRQLLLGFFLLLAGRASAQTWQAAVPFNATVAASVTDFSGDVYLTGSFVSRATFGSTALATAATGDTDMFVAKWSPATGAFVWAVRGGGAGNDYGTALTTYSNVLTGGATVYVTGSFGGATATFGTTPLNNASPTGATSDLFVANLTDAGNWQWALRGGGSGNDTGRALAVGSNGVYVAGLFAGPTASFGSIALANPGGSSGTAYAFLAKFSDNGITGTFGWAQAGGGTQTEFNGLVANGTSVYLAVNYSGATASFGGVSVANFDPTGTTFDVVLAKFTDAGSAASTTWLKRAGGSGNDFANGLALNGSSLYLSGGIFSSTAAFDGVTLSSTATSAFLAKLTDVGPSGTFNWAQQVTGTGAYAGPYLVAANGTGVYLAGSFTGASLTIGGTILTNTSAATSEVCAAKFVDAGSSASLAWATTAGGTGADAASALTTGFNGAVYVSGSMGASATFGSQTITNTNTTKGFFATIPGPGPVLSLVAPSSAPVGSTITLYGRNLTGTTSITFTGGSFVSSGFTVNAAGTQISGIVVPAGAQSGPVVTGYSGGNSNGVAFTVAPASTAPVWQSVAAATAASIIRFATPDASGNILVAGTFGGTLVLGGTTLTSVGGRDLFVAKWSPATSSYVWAQRAGSSGDDDVYGLVVNGGSVYLDGLTYGQVATFGSTTLTSVQGYAGYVAKLTDAGSSASFTWAQLIDDSSFVFVESLAVSGSSVYIGGDYTGTGLRLGTGTLPGNSSDDDGFIAKFIDNGATASFAWVKGMGGASGSSINVYGIVVQGSTVYLSGAMTGTVSFGSTTLTASGSTDVAVVKLIDAGSTASFSTAIRTGGTGFEFVLNMVAGAGNALYLSGETTSIIWPGTPAIGTGNYNGFVAKVTDTGTALAVSWVQLLGGAAYQLAANGTGVYVTGFYSGTSSFGTTSMAAAGGYDGFVARLADAGSSATLSWAQSFGGPANDWGNALALSGGRAYVGGYATPAASFGNLAITSPAGVSVATLGVLADPAILATAAPVAAAGQLRIYPNPAHGAATVQLPATAEKAPLMLLDALGREARRYPAPAGAEATLDLRGLPAGLYVLRGAGAAQRLVVE